jgi:hypothetical protein
VPFSFAAERTAAAAGLGDFYILSLSQCLLLYVFTLFYCGTTFVYITAELLLLLFHFFLFFVVPQQQQWPYTIRRREPLFDL